MTSVSVRVDQQIAARGSLYDFVRLAWPHVVRTKYVDNWHIETLSNALEEMSYGRIRKMAAAVPPGSGKSLLTGVFWPTWHWLRFPTDKWIYGSFDYKLVGKRDGGRVLDLMHSAWWRDRWPHVQPVHKNASAQDFDLTTGGFRFATSPRGKGTGRHANITVIDDPIKPIGLRGSGAVTKSALLEVEAWYTQTLSMRMAEPSTHRELCIMQRLDANDLSGLFQRDPRCYHLRLPMLYEAAHPTPGDPRTREGELLWPARFDATTVAEMIRTLGPQGAAAQLQQRPYVAGGGIFKRAWWRFWSRSGPSKSEPCLCEACFTAGRSSPAHDSGRPCATLPTEGSDIASWDLTFKNKASSDLVAGLGFRAAGGRIFNTWISNERRDFVETRAEITARKILWPGKILVEDAANGPAIASELRDVQLLPAVGDKRARAWASTLVISLGDVYLQHPDENPSTWDVLKQTEAFPFDLHDDLVDALAQGVTWYRGNGATRAREMLELIGKQMGVG